MYMSEDYNSPQSPYWAMKSFVALGLPPHHPFWATDETPLPLEEVRLSAPVKPPMQIICHSKHHHFLLSSGQFCPWPLKATEAKYGKFAYSSHFGFSVPTGNLIQQIAPDSTLALSKDDGDTWRVPWKVQDIEFGTAWLRRGCEILEEVPTVKSIWKPWKDVNVEVSTLLVAPCQRWPDWHLRTHRIKNLGSSKVTIRSLQGGFAIQGREDRLGGVLPSYTEDSYMDQAAVFPRCGESTVPEGTQETWTSALVCSSAGTSGIRTMAFSHLGQAKGEVLKPDSNSNLIWQRTLIPTVNSTTTLLEGETSRLDSAVFAVGRNSGFENEYDDYSIEEKWKDIPQVAGSDMVKLPRPDFILLPRD